MRIIYILKKGLHFFPPCLNQVLVLKDLGCDIVVYHGKESNYINSLLEERNIEHHELASDNYKIGKINQAKKYVRYYRELKEIVSNADTNDVIWFGNAESAIAALGLLENRKYVLSILELYKDGSRINVLLSKIIKKAKAVICCEKHRAAIMVSQFGLDNYPFVIPNKAYELDAEGGDLLELVNQNHASILEDPKCFVIVYQGIISKDRPLKSVAVALSKINDPDIYFYIMGKGDMQMIQEVKTIYDRVVYLGYIPSPQHTVVTKYANIGIANYDMSCLNNVFCAPNKIYEYSKYGVPMIVSKNIGLIETVCDYGAAVPVDYNNNDDLVNAITHIKNSNSQYKENAIRFYNSTDTRGTIKDIIEKLTYADC